MARIEPREPRGVLARAWHVSGPVLTVLAVVLLLWHAAAVWLNAPQVIERSLSAQPGWGALDLVRETLSMSRPVLPAPHQIALDLFDSVFGWPLDSPRNLLFHVAVTSSATLLGFVMGSALGDVPPANLSLDCTTKSVRCHRYIPLSPPIPGDEHAPHRLVRP